MISWCACAEVFSLLGSIHLDGDAGMCVAKDEAAAMLFFERAAELGDPLAAYLCSSHTLMLLGDSYGDSASASGGVENTLVCSDADAEQRRRQRCQEAHARLVQVADTHQLPDALYFLALLYRNGHSGLRGQHSGGGDGDGDRGGVDMRKFHLYLQRAVSQQHAEAAFCLADMHLHGSDGAPMSVAEARRCYSLAVELGHADAALCLGSLYYHGRGVPVDKQVAFALYNVAAERGCREAWRNLVGMYLHGDGVPTGADPKMAAHIIRTIFTSEETVRDKNNEHSPK